MTPKEKAEELYNKYWDKLWEIQDRIENLHEQAKQCALIAVDEILKSHHNLYGVNSKATKFYLEVKNEIEKL